MLKYTIISRHKYQKTKKSLEAKNSPQMAIVYKRQNLYAKTLHRKQPFMEKK